MNHTKYQSFFLFNFLFRRIIWIITTFQRKNIFETFIKVTNSNNFIEYNKEELHKINNVVLDSVMLAHYKGKVPCLEIEISELDIESISSLIYFFMLSAAFSAFLFGVYPFDQPGVEAYKQELQKLL